MAKRRIKLSKEQQKAVSHRDGHAMVLSAAGSGKTRVIEQRALKLIAEGHDARKILIVTHTNKAVGEIRTRITAPEAAGVAIGTIHSLGLQILREYNLRAGLPAAFSVATS